MSPCPFPTTITITPRAPPHIGRGQYVTLTKVKEPILLYNLLIYVRVGWRRTRDSCLSPKALAESETQTSSFSIWTLVADSITLSVPPRLYIYIYIYIYIYNVSLSRAASTHFPASPFVPIIYCDILLWTPSHGRARVGRLRNTYQQQLCMDIGCSP